MTDSAPASLHAQLDMMAPFLELAKRTNWGCQIVIFQDKDGNVSAEPRLTIGPKVGKKES